MPKFSCPPEPRQSYGFAAGAAVPGATGWNDWPLTAGCSGMAGPWGLLAKNRSTSLAAGEKMIAAFSGPDAIFGSSECGSCRIQMQDATGKRAVHPIQYLAMAYGLLPEVGRRLVMPLKDRVSR